jgi:hypothetical protein
MTQPPKPHSIRHASFTGRIGIARTEITPPVGIYARNWGAAKHDVASAIHRPLTLTAMTLEAGAGGPRLVLLDADLGWWGSIQTHRDFQNRLHQALGVNSGHLIFALSHTHSGPPIMDVDESLPGSDLHRTWMKELFDKSVRTVQHAMESRFAGAIEWHTGRCSLATNRDLPDPERARVVCGYNPDSDPDDTVLVGRVTDSSGKIRASLVNYACHPTTLAWDNVAISPDYVGAMRETIQQATGAPALFLLGACGELAPRYQYVGDTEVADQHGRELGFAALAALNAMEPPGMQLSYAGVVESGAPLAVWKHEPAERSRQLQAHRVTAGAPLKDWPSAEVLEQQHRECTDRALKERIRRKLTIRRGIGDGSRFDLPIYVWRIGDAVLVGCAGEAYSVLQKELRRRFPETAVVCMNLINGSIGYLPPAEFYELDTYAVWQTPFDRGSLELVFETMCQAIRDVLKR